MTRLRAGIKAGVGPVLKIMKNDGDDPFTTPNSHLAKFVFNSETEQLSYLLDVLKFEYGGPATYPPGTGLGTPNVYYPDAPSAIHRVESFNDGSSYHERHFYDFKSAYGLGYMPWVDLREFVPADSRVKCQTFRYEDEINADFTRNGRSYDASTLSQVMVTHLSGNPFYSQAVAHFGAGRTPTSSKVVADVWEFPMDDGAYSFPSAAVVPGQKVLTIRPTRAAMARPGFDVDSASGRQLIFDSNRIPAKILAAGEITLPGSGHYDVMIDAAFHPLSPFTRVDAHHRYASVGTLFHPNFGQSGSWWTAGPTFDYRVLSDRVRFISSNAADVVIRYLILADEGEGTSGGGTPVLRGGPAHGFIQICRPGAANPPNLHDIILDSRLPYVPIVAQGYIPKASFSIASDLPGFGTHRAADIPFNYPGMIPFVKLSAYGVFKHPGSGYQYYTAAGSAGMQRWVNTPTLYNGEHPPFCPVALIGSNYVRIYNSPNNPTWVGWDGYGGTIIQYGYDLYGVRYTIFAIPAPEAP